VESIDTSRVRFVRRKMEQWGSDGDFFKVTGSGVKRGFSGEGRAGFSRFGKEQGWGDGQRLGVRAGVWWMAQWFGAVGSQSLMSWEAFRPHNCVRQRGFGVLIRKEDFDHALVHGIPFCAKPSILPPGESAEVDSLKRSGQ